jgi:hypothetical protein
MAATMRPDVLDDCVTMYSTTVVGGPIGRHKCRAYEPPCLPRLLAQSTWKNVARPVGISAASLPNLSDRRLLAGRNRGPVGAYRIRLPGQAYSRSASPTRRLIYFSACRPRCLHNRRQQWHRTRHGAGFCRRGMQPRDRGSPAGAARGARAGAARPRRRGRFRAEAGRARPG